MSVAPGRRLVPVITCIVVVVAAAALLVACSDDNGDGGSSSGGSGSTGAAAFCHARDDLVTALDGVKGLDVTTASSDEVDTALNDLGAAVGNVIATAGTEFGADARRVKSTLDTVSNVIDASGSPPSKEEAVTINRAVENFKSAANDFVDETSSACS